MDLLSTKYTNLLFDTYFLHLVFLESANSVSSVERGANLILAQGP